MDAVLIRSAIGTLPSPRWTVGNRPVAFVLAPAAPASKPEDPSDPGAPVVLVVEDGGPDRDDVSRTARGAIWPATSKGSQTIVLLALAAVLAPSALGVIALGTLVSNLSAVLVMHGSGVMALVVGQIVQVVLTMGLAWVVHPRVPPGFNLADARQLLSYGGRDDPRHVMRPQTRAVAHALRPAVSTMRRVGGRRRGPRA